MCIRDRYYLALYNQSYPQPPMPDGVAEGIVKGLYRFKEGPSDHSQRAQLLVSGPIMPDALRAQELLAAEHDVSVDIWSATSYHQLRLDALDVERWNRFHPGEPRKQPYVTKQLENQDGPVIAVSDHMKAVPDQVRRWVPAPFFPVSYTHLRAHETVLDLVCRLLL